MLNLLPRKGADNSGRARPVGSSLLPPIYFLPTMNLYATQQDGQDMKQRLSPSTWMKTGRPIWGSRMAADESPEVVKCDSVLRFAGEKLVGNLKSDNFQGQVVDVLAGKMTEGQAMALLGAAAGLDVCPRSLLAETLAASHMNLVLRVSKDRSRMYVTIPPEPILSEAACGFLSKEAVQLGALQWMQKACMQGYVTPGPRGEFVAKFILVAAVWSLKKKYCLRPIKVEDYLRKLLSNGLQDRATFSKLEERLPKNGIVFFNSFVVSRKLPDEAMLAEFWERGYGIMYRAENSLPGADMIIPVWTPSGMTALIVSVKNVQNPGWLEKVSNVKVRCEFTRVQIAQDLNVVTIVMSLREPGVKEPTNWLLWEENKDNEFTAQEAAEIRRHAHLTCYGIEDNYSFLSKEVRSALSNLLVTVPDPFVDCDDNERRWIERMVPQFAV